MGISTETRRYNVCVCVCFTVVYSSERSAVRFCIRVGLQHGGNYGTSLFNSDRLSLKKQRQPECVTPTVSDSNAVFFLGRSSLGRVSGSGGGLTAWTRPGNKCWTKWGAQNVRICTCMLLHTRTYVYVLTYSRRSLWWYRTYLTRFEVLPF